MAADNLKTRVTADTSDFKKGMREASTALKSFEKQGKGAVNGLAQSLGGLDGVLGSLSGNITNATNLFRGLFRQSEAGLTSMRSSIAAVGGALAGLGITAVITAFQELNREAQNFEQRLQGVNLAASAKAYRETYRQALDDMTGAGEGTATWWEGLKDNFSREWTDLMNIGASRQQRAMAHNLAVDAANLASERVDLQREMDAFVVTEAQYRKDINDQLLIAKDRSKSKAERDAAQAEAVRLTNKLYDDQIALSGRVLANQEAQDALTSNTDAETRETYQAQANMLRLEAQRTQELTTLNKLENTIAGSKTSQAGSAKETQQATELTLAAATELVKQERALQAIQDQNDAMKAAARFRLDGALPGVEGNLQASANALTVPALIKPVVDTEQAQQAVIELTSIVESGVVGMSEALGDLIGNLINGEAAWSNFAQAGIDVVADMLSTVGKAFITEGIGVEAAKLALKSGNGIAAIAAGSAMVALAAAMKTTMSNAAANWSGGGGAAVASSSYSSGSLSAGSVAQTVNVRVTGTLTGEGSKLKAVLNNEDTRLATTT